MQTQAGTPRTKSFYFVYNGEDKRFQREKETVFILNSKVYNMIAVVRTRVRFSLGLGDCHLLATGAFFLELEKLL